MYLFIVLLHQRPYRVSNRREREERKKGKEIWAREILGSRLYLWTQFTSTIKIVQMEKNKCLYIVSVWDRRVSFSIFSHIFQQLALHIFSSFSRLNSRLQTYSMQSTLTLFLSLSLARLSCTQDSRSKKLEIQIQRNVLFINVVCLLFHITYYTS